MYPMSTVEPTYKMILAVVKALLNEDAPPKTVLAAIGAMEDTITDAEARHEELAETFSAVQPFLKS